MVMGQCFRTWHNDEQPGYDHRCRRGLGHEGPHECIEGARKEDRVDPDPDDEVPIRGPEIPDGDEEL